MYDINKVRYLSQMQSLTQSIIFLTWGIIVFAIHLRTGKGGKKPHVAIYFTIPFVIILSCLVAEYFSRLILRTP